MEDPDDDELNDELAEMEAELASDNYKDLSMAPNKAVNNQGMNTQEPVKAKKQDDLFADLMSM
jgi:hypothetical protein